MSVQHIGWEQYGQWVELLVAAVKARNEVAEFEDIVAITRGGLLPAIAMTHAMPKLRMHIWDVQRRPHEAGGRGDPVIRHSPTPFKGPRKSGAGVLIVDDVVDEGLTAAAVVGRVEQYAGFASSFPRYIVIATLCASERHSTRTGSEGDLIAVQWKTDNLSIRLPYEQ